LSVAGGSIEIAQMRAKRRLALRGICEPTL
jgi:hypothetical protein